MISAAIGVLYCAPHAHADEDEEEEEIRYVPPMEQGYTVTQCPASLAGQKGCYSAFSHLATSVGKNFGTAESWDLDSSSAEPHVLAVADGTVTEVRKGWTKEAGGNSYGNYVRIRHADGTYSFYAHLASVDVDDGDEVDAGDVIGIMGNSGGPWCFGKSCCGTVTPCTHLHFSLYSDDGSPMSTNDRIDVFAQEGAIAKAKRNVREGVTAIASAFGINIEFKMRDVKPEYKWNEDIIEPEIKEVHLDKIDLSAFRQEIAKFYRFALGIGAMLAFLIIIYGGILYILSAGNPAKQLDAKEWITAALIGLVLLFSAYLILQAINPCLVRSC